MFEKESIEKLKNIQEKAPDAKEEIVLSEKQKAVDQERIERGKYKFEVDELEGDRERLREIDELGKKSGMDVSKTEEEIKNKIKELEEETSEFKLHHSDDEKKAGEIEKTEGDDTYSRKKSETEAKENIVKLEQSEREDALKKIEKIEENLKEKGKQEKKAEGIEDLRELVWEDKMERSLVVYEVNGKTELFEEGDCRKDFCYISFDRVKEAFDKGSKKVINIHTHPLKAYSFSEDQIKSIKDERVEASPMPMSQTDITGLIQQFNFLKSSGFNLDGLENKIIDPTGEWTYKIEDKENYFIRRYGSLLEKYSNKETWEKLLSEDEKEEIKKKKELIDSTHPENRFIYMPDRIREMIAEEASGEFPEKKWFDLFGENKFDYLKSYSECSNLSREIAKYSKGRKKEETEVLIGEYIEKCKKIGIDVSYKPFKE